MRWRTTTTALLSCFLLACGGGSGGGDRVVEGVDLAALFAPPTQAEIDAVRADWTTRRVAADDAQVVASALQTVGGAEFSVRVVSHRVGGVLHHGAILHRTGALDGSLPVLVYAHGGDGGVDVDELLPLIPFLLGADFDAFVFVIPSFRAETLTYDGVDYTSEGPPSPWDRDVADALRGTLADLPGLADLDVQVIQPLKSGTLDLAQARLELLRRSPARFAAGLPPVQIHHGTADPIVPVTQGERLRDVLQALGGSGPDFEAWFYPGGGHDPLTLIGAFPRTLDFLARLQP